ncbi:hypothetical protein AB1Y20_012044 [Prymnesium parvum]|uniref:Uncharacterized protein n=1 Tax=Prymnesium parvum TaxID=97485 RepID=A0AB34IMC9_PRYPA
MAESRLPLLLVALVFGGRQVTKFLSRAPVITCESSQPLVRTLRQALSEEELHALQHEIDQMLPTLTENNLGYGFKKTRGFVLKFNRNGAKKLRDLSFMNGTYRLSGSILRPFHSGPAVSLHVDDTVGINSVRKYLAHSVSVLYLSVPSSMIGGSLRLWRWGGEPKTLDNPEATVTPEENKLTVFRGDSYHMVEAWTSATDEDVFVPALKSMRVSLVLEAYRISDEVYPQATEFDASTDVEVNSARAALAAYNDITSIALIVLCLIAAAVCVVEVMGWHRVSRGSAPGVSRDAKGDDAQALGNKGDVRKRTGRNNKGAASR